METFGQKPYTATFNSIKHLKWCYHNYSLCIVGISITEATVHRSSSESTGGHTTIALLDLDPNFKVFHHKISPCKLSYVSIVDLDFDLPSFWSLFWDYRGFLDSSTPGKKLSSLLMHLYSLTVSRYSPCHFFSEFVLST